MWESSGGTRSEFREICVNVLGKLAVAALAGWAVLAAAEFVLLFGVFRVFAMVMGPELLPSLKVVLDMGALAACGWVAGRVGRPRVVAAACLCAAGIAAFDLSPYLPLNVSWLLRLTINAIRDSRYLTSLLTLLGIHVLLFGSLFAGARLSCPRASIAIPLHID
jgi:hypothetical protein